MEIRKSIFSVIVAVALLAGFTGGFWTSHYKFITAPQKKAQEMVKKQQEALSKMVRHGEVVSVEPEKLTVKVEKGGGDIGKTITVKTNEYAAVQVGMGFVSKPNEKTDLTKFFRVGDSIDMLVKDDQTFSLHREFRPGEEQKPPFAQEQTSSKQGLPAQGQ